MNGESRMDSHMSWFMLVLEPENAGKTEDQRTTLPTFQTDPNIPLMVVPHGCCMGWGYDPS